MQGASPNEKASSSPSPARRPIPLAAAETAVRSSSPDSVSSLARARWERLRQHVVLPSYPAPYGHSQQSSSVSSLTSSVRTQPPKPSRFARLGFRQVVEQAREASQDISRKFSDDIEKACWSCHYVEALKGRKVDRDGAFGSPSYFMSNISLPATTQLRPNSITSSGQRKNDTRVPQPLQFFPTSSQPVASLLNTLRQYAPSSSNLMNPISHLPHESQVLSVFLAPFLPPESSRRTDEERMISVEAFEIAVKTWKAETKVLTVERCLWCCKAAATSASPLRLRILGILWSLLLPRDSSFRADTPDILQTLIQALFLLLQSLSRQVSEIEEINLVKQLISQVRAGACGELDRISVDEEYGATSLKKDNDQSVREAVILESLARCLENSGETTQSWIMGNLMEEYWPLPQQSLSFTPLLKAIYIRKLNIFSRAAVTLLQAKTGGSPTRRMDAEIIVRIFQTRVVPEIEAVQGQGAEEVRAHAIRIILELFNTDDSTETQQWGTVLFCHWYQIREWQPSFENAFGELINNHNWFTVLRITTQLMQSLSDEFRKSVVAFTLPQLNNRMVANPPAHPCQPLTGLLDAISRWYPSIFYKPLFSCAASPKESTVVNHLCTITAISKFLPDFWLRDVDMITTALMVDVGDQGKGKSTGTAGPVWGKARLGQSAFLLELIRWIQALRNPMDISGNPEANSIDKMKFVSALESRLSILLEAKEAKTWVPMSQRLLFCMLFLQIRLFTQSLKSVPWLSRIISWFLQYYQDTTGNGKISFDEDIRDTATQFHSLYSAAQESARSSYQRRSTMVLSPTVPVVQTPDLSAVLEEKRQIIATFSKGFVTTTLELIVALSGLLTPQDHRRLGPILWNECLDSRSRETIPLACFLVMQCAEKYSDFTVILDDDLGSPDPSVNLRAIERLNILSNWRFQILSQRVIVGRQHRRPFRLAQDPLPFVATDIGSNLFVLVEDPNDLKDNLPLELRKRLSEIGWVEDDKPVDQQLEWVRTPMLLLPVHQLDLLDSLSQQTLLSPPSPNLSPAPSPTKSPLLDDVQENEIHRRKSSSGPMYGVKRRVVFVPALAALLPHLASLVFDANFAVASTARNAIVDLMRNDPSILARPVFDLLEENQKDLGTAIWTLRAFLHVRPVLPPAFVHRVFNSLAGFLKNAARLVESPETFKSFAQIIPTLSQIGTQVSDMSIREIRRAKIEVFLIPSGSLWFPSSAPAGSMFPRTLGSTNNPFDAVTSHLVSMSIIRLSQNMFFLEMLKQNPQDIQLVRKNMSNLVLPSKDNQCTSGPLELIDLVPRKASQIDVVPLDTGLKSLSLMLSRSYLLVVAQIFRSLSRHLSDRNELAIYIDGINRTLLAHGDDIGIVTQAMIALMVASTRFRRLFASGGGFLLFMPTLIKTYAESENHFGIRQAIIYAVHRFFAQHHDTFVFQSIDIISHVMMTPDIDGDWIAKNVYSLFSTLKTGIPPSISDAAGIRNSNKDQEREALLVSTAEEKPHTFLASLRQGGNNGKDLVATALPEEYESKRLRLDDFVKLFLTVIAHDTSISRAERFLRLFRFLAPYFYHASGSARSVLGDGVDALGLVLSKAVGKAKASEPLPGRPADLIHQPSEVTSTENPLLRGFRAPSDLVSMRLDYLSLVVAFTRSGGQLPIPSSRRTIELIKVILRDSTGHKTERIASFFTDFTWTSLIRADHPNLKYILAFLGDLVPVISHYAIAVDFSGVFNTVTHLAANPFFANEPLFSQLIVNQMCSAALNACELAASERLLSSLPMRLSLVSLMAKAIFLRGADLMAELEKCTPSFDFLTGIILPLIITLKNSTDTFSGDPQMESWHYDVLARTWIRLLSYTILACHKGISAQESLSVPERTKSHNKRHSTTSFVVSSNSQISVIVMALQLVKVIIIGAESDLSSTLPGIWPRVASFFTSLLQDGNADFGLQYFSSMSPARSSRAGSARFDSGLNPSPSAEFCPESPSLNVPSQSLRRPRIVDYSLWSLFELLCRSRNPLQLQMRLFIRVKVAALDQELRSQETSGYKDRPISSVFSKPRRMSGLPSPDNSLRISPSQSFPTSPSLDTIRQPGFRQFLSSPTTPQETHGHRIVHLGPVNSTPTLQRSGGEIGVRPMAKSPMIKSLSLVRATYRRIRLVQSSMGYDSLLLPLPHGERDDEDQVWAVSWTVKQAFEATVKETNELMREFDESSRLEEEDGIIV